MSVAVLGMLGALALVDGACSGFRSAQGRTGLVDHAALDPKAASLGVLAVAIALVPASLVFALDVGAAGTPVESYTSAGAAMLVVLVPYAVVVGLALGAYAVLGWRQKYVAMAVVLGPLTLVRPVVALGAGMAGIRTGDTGTVVATIALATVAVLLVEPVLGRCWVEPVLAGSGT